MPSKSHNSRAGGASKDCVGADSEDEARGGRRQDVRVGIQNLHNDAFDVGQGTKKLFDDYTRIYFDLLEGRRVLRSLQPH